MEKRELSCLQVAGTLLRFSHCGWTADGSNPELGTVWWGLSQAGTPGFLPMEDGPQRRDGGSSRCGQQIQPCVCSSGTKLAYKGVVFKLLKFGLIHKIHARLRNFPSFYSVRLQYIILRF